MKTTNDVGPELSQEQAGEVLSRMTGEQISRLRQMAATFKAPWAGKHNAARKLRAQARISHRKAKRKA